MLRSVAGWDQLADLPFSFDPSVWVLTDDGPFRHLVDPAQGGLRRQDVAQVLGYDPARLILIPPEPPIRDFSHVGLCTSAVLTVLVISQAVAQPARTAFRALRCLSGPKADSVRPDLDYLP